MTEISDNFSCVSKRQWVIGGVVTGLALALALAGVVAIAFLINSVQQREIRHNAARIEAERRTNRRQAVLIKELREIKSPTPAQYRQQLRRGIRLCLREPTCRRLFPSLRARASQTSLSSPTLTSPSSGPTRTTPTVPSPVRHHSSARHPGHSKASRPTPSARPSPSAPSPPPASSGGEPSPTVGVTAPVPVQVCADGLLSLNC